jgi:nicotinate-nucleotide--dimethylbenzimidazole phosphoribosyltransferase
MIRTLAETNGTGAGRRLGHTCPVTALLEVGADVAWTDGDAASAARAGMRPGAGRLGELVEWLASTQGRFPVTMPGRVRCIVIGSVDERVAERAAAMGVGIREVSAAGEPGAAFSSGASVTDDEVEAGADLFVLVANDPGLAPAVAVGVFAGAEPVALLPRGAQALDTQAWIERAGRLREARRRAAELRNRPEALLAELGSPVLATAAGVALRAAARRTPLVLDGATALAAALLCIDLQSLAAQWWRIADTSDDPVHAVAAQELGTRPVLELGTDLGDGTAGLLAVTVLRAAITTSGAADE